MGKQIDFIVPHYNEPWEIGEKFFRMLALQRNVNFNDIRVLIVQDGEEGNLEWNTLLTNLPYDVKVLTIPHGGVSAAKNAGLGAATAEWVMFCDFDDMFADVCSLNMILGLMPTDKADILWMNTYREQYMRGKDPFVNCIEDNFTFAYGKLFRRSFLKECGICFPDIPFEADYAFCSLALSECESTRVLRITTKFTMYMKTIRKLSYTLQRKNISRMVESIFFADTYLVNEYDRRGNIDEKRTAVAKTILDTYYILNCTPKINHAQEIERLFIEFYNENKQLFEEVNPHEMEIVVDASEKHLCNVLMTLYNNFLVEAGAPECGINHVRKWLRRIGAHKEAYMYENNNVKSQVIYENKAKVVSVPVNVEENHENGQEKEPEISDNDTEDDIRQGADTDERVIVYSGTRNTYECILASLKSVVAHSRVDKAYLLIEDDEFPFEVPDFVTVINVSNQTFFDKNGPNFNCSWSYMCLMRAAYPKLFPQHKKVLSLDIDTIVLDDIEGLWNTDLSDYYIAGVHEKDKAQSDYINFGVVLMNLELLRKEEVDEQMIHLLNTAKQNCPEQDVFNTTCEGKILCLPSEYNYTPFTHLIAEPEHERIIHYAGIQYWKGFSPSQKYLRMSWDDVYAMRQDMNEPEQADADEQTEDDDFDKKKPCIMGENTRCLR